MDKAFAKSQTHQLSIQLYHKNENSNAPSGFFFNMKTTIRNLPSSKRCLDQVTTFIITIAQIHNACKMLSSTRCKSNKKCRRNLYFHQSRSQKQHHSNNQMLHPTQKQIVQQNHPFGL